MLTPWTGTRDTLRIAHGFSDLGHFDRVNVTNMYGYIWYETWRSKDSELGEGEW